MKPTRAMRLAKKRWRTTIRPLNESPRVRFRLNRCVEIGVLAFVVWLAVFGSSAQPLQAQGQPEPPPDTLLAEAWPGEYIVVLEPGSNEVAAAQAQLALAGELIDQVTPCGSNTMLQIWRLYNPDAGPAFQALADTPGIASIEPNWVVRAAGIPAPPPPAPERPYTFNDTFYASHQWPLQRSSFARAWQLIQERNLPLQKVRIAVIDSGVDFSHPDLAGRLLPGFNYIITTTAPIDDFGHGTHVTGIIAAIANNGIGVAGGAPNIEIDPLKMLGSNGGGTVPNLIRAICDAADRGAAVINMSLEIPTGAITLPTADTIQQAVDYAYDNDRGSLLVAAAGNSNGGPVYYPARLDHVVAVAALTPENTRASYSAVGTQLDIAAGGGSFARSVLSTWSALVPGKCTGTGRVLLNEGGAYYCTEPGTSMAAPLVSAAAALLKSIRPALTADAIEAILKQTARDVGLPQSEVGAGLLDAEAAVRRLLASEVRISPRRIDATLPPGALPFTQTVIIDTPALTPLNVSGVISPTPWLQVVNVAGSSFSADISYGAPLYLTFVVSPTHLITGTYSSAVELAITYPDSSVRSDAVSVTVSIGDWVTHRTYVPLMLGGAGQTPPRAFEWEEPDGAPTVLSIQSSGYVTVSLPFAFPLSGVGAIDAAATYTQAHVYEDGFLAFASGPFLPVAEPSQNRCLPVLDQPGQAIFGWWADLDPGLSGGVISAFQPAPDRFVIQYEDVASAAGTEPPYTVTFQIVLHSNGNIGLNYLEVPDAVAQDLGELTPEVTVGVQARNGLFYNQATCITLSEGYGRPPHSQTSILIAREDVY